MTCTTFLYDYELDIPTSNKELNATLALVRKETAENWQIVERQHIVRYGFLKAKSKVKFNYELYKEVGGIGPYQLINFYRDEMTSSMNFANSGELVMAFLYGMLAGVNVIERKYEIK